MFCVGAESEHENTHRYRWLGYRYGKTIVQLTGGDQLFVWAIDDSWEVLKNISLAFTTTKIYFHLIVAVHFTLNKWNQINTVLTKLKNMTWFPSKQKLINNFHLLPVLKNTALRFIIIKTTRNCISSRWHNCQ